MFQNDKKCVVFNVTKLDKAMHRRQKKREKTLDTSDSVQFFKPRLCLKRRENFLSLFHMAIISTLLLNFAGCGYKGDPYYEESIDENVSVIIHHTKEPK